MLRRFLPYIEKVFGFRKLIAKLQEPRQAPRIPLESIFGAAFLMFACNRVSLNAFKPFLRHPQRLKGLLGPQLPSVTTIGRVYADMDPAPLRTMLVSIAHRLKRNKVFELTTELPLRFAAVDGHEFFASYDRCCEECSQRVVHVNGEAKTQYYHRGVFVSLVGYEPALVLDVEFCRAGEGEWPAAATRCACARCCAACSPIIPGSSTRWWGMSCTPRRRFSIFAGSTPSIRWR